MIKVTISTDALQKTLRQIERNLDRAASRLTLILRGRQGRIGLTAIRLLGRVPGSPVYPIRWKSERQRKAFFASKGFGRGVPTRRRNVIIRAWEVKLGTRPGGGSVTLYNPQDAWVFLQGDQAQPFHLDTGYVQVEDVIDQFRKEAADTVVDAWVLAADPFQE
jgi:hypothetical protein